MDSKVEAILSKLSRQLLGKHNSKDTVTIDYSGTVLSTHMSRKDAYTAHSIKGFSKVTDGIYKAKKKLFIYKTLYDTMTQEDINNIINIATTRKKRS